MEVRATAPLGVEEARAGKVPAPPHLPNAASPKAPNPMADLHKRKTRLSEVANIKENPAGKRFGITEELEEEDSEGNNSDMLGRNMKTSDEPPAAPAKSSIQRAIKADTRGDRRGAKMYFKMHKSMEGQPTRKPNPPAPKGGNPKRPRSPSPQHSSNTDQGTEEDDEEGEPNSSSKEEDKDKGEGDSGKSSDKETTVSGINFISGLIPTHDDMGFTPYFDKNCRELKGPIPLTIFNKTWRNAAIMHHTEKRSKLDNLSINRNCYTSYPYPSKWTQSFSKWTVNHCKFHRTMKQVYKYKKLARWILKHKRNANMIHTEEGFIVALRYDIQIRTNTFAHWVTRKDGTQSVARSQNSGRRGGGTGRLGPDNGYQASKEESWEHSTKEGNTGGQASHLLKPKASSNQAAKDIRLQGKHF
ncbi:hypothetical protein PCASD_18474 [Puccinia coronata f. sp. avenae]|uniref:Uncharacterized protein n=1 Tax=Puccinia coronata f. sp. avenae TaxID=200324 RepID=A0A2N5SU07_9BASI|nr:hypothetical protein PCASD_18474 [Puccinia coronata f. sp. avenae]